MVLRPTATYSLKSSLPQFCYTDTTERSPLFDTLTATAEYLQSQLVAGNLKSTQIVQEYIRAIYRHNGRLNAVWEVAADALARAEQLDDMRSRGVVLGPLHGIPVLIKDNIDIEGWETTCGAVALSKSKPRRSASIIDRLQDAGMIIMGKTTLSEMGAFKGNGIRSAWSAIAGHAQSAYVRGGLDMDDGLTGHSSPSGSSSGSAIAVSAGFAPIAIGTETSGSLVMPATRASLYSVKPTLGIVPGDGIVPICFHYDQAGPMAKSPKDVADILTLLVDPKKTSVPMGGYASALDGAWKDIKVGTLYPELWFLPPETVKPVKEATDQIISETHRAYEKIKGLAKSYRGDVSHDTDADFGDSLVRRLTFSMEGDINEYLSTLKESRVRTLRELVDWNFAHFDEALTAEYPNQDLLVGCLEAEHSPEALQKIEGEVDSVGNKFMALFADYNIDVIIAPGDSGLYHFSLACGFPMATLPLSYLAFNGRPIGLTVAAPPHREDVLFNVMSAWEKTFAQWQPPTAFLSATVPKS